MAISIEETFGYRLGRHSRGEIHRIVIVGCGGNGSHLISDVARMISTSGITCDIILIDGDRVEDKNVIRQNFIKADVGKYKSDVLAERYGAAFGLTIGSMSEYLTRENCNHLVDRRTLWVTCTDNLKSRQIVRDFYSGIWIDLGNEEVGGQATLSTLGSDYYSGWYEDGEDFLLPNVFELFPIYEERANAEKDISELSCAEFAEASPLQAGFVNATCAIFAKNWIHALFTMRKIKTHQVFYTIDNTFEQRTIKKSSIEKWIKDFPRFGGMRI